MFSHAQIRSYLEQTLNEARKAMRQGNYPIGALIVNTRGKVESVTRNRCLTNEDITAHAEILGIRNLKRKIDNRAKGEYYLFSSLEPCFGCSFFIARTNITHIISAYKDPHKGGISRLQKLDMFGHFFGHIKLLNEPFEDLKEQSRQLMIDFYTNKGNTDAAAYYKN